MDIFVVWDVVLGFLGQLSNVKDRPQYFKILGNDTN